jgi:hypothetical protein
MFDDLSPLNLDDAPTPKASPAPAPLPAKTSKHSQPQGLAVDVFYNPERLNMMVAFARKLFEAKCFSSDVKNPEQALVKIQAGAEMGMGPIESMTSLCIINGNISIWGKGASKRLRDHGWSLFYTDETENSVTVSITKGKEVHKYTATAEEVGSLKSQALKFAKKDKLKWHAIGRLIRFYVPEVLGAVSYVAEELEEATVEIVDTKPETNLQGGIVQKNF